jgi:hypothetical protein
VGNTPSGWLPPPYSTLGIRLTGFGEFCYTDALFGNANTNFVNQFDLGLVNGGLGSPWDPPGKEFYIGQNGGAMNGIGAKIYGLILPTLKMSAYNNFAAPPPPPTDAYLWVEMITSPFNPLTLTWNIALGLGSVPFTSVLIGVGVPGSCAAEVKGCFVSASAPVVLAAPIYGFRLRCVPIGAIFPDNAALFKFSAPNPAADGWGVVAG